MIFMIVICMLVGKIISEMAEARGEAIICIHTK